MFSTIKQYLSSSNNSDNYSNYYDNSWRRHKNHHLGNWLTDMARPFSTAMPLDENEQRFFWNRGRHKKNKYYSDPYYENQHAMMYGNNRLRNKSSSKSLSSFLRINRHDDGYPHYYNNSHYEPSGHSYHPNNNQYNRHSTMNNKNGTRRQRHNSLPSSVSPYNGQQPYMKGGVGMPFDPMANTMMNGNGGVNIPGYNPMTQHQYPYQQQQQPYYQQFDEHSIKSQPYSNGHLPHSNGHIMNNHHLQQNNSNHNGHAHQNGRHHSINSSNQSMYPSSYGQQAAGMYIDPNYYYQQQQQQQQQQQLQYNNDFYPNSGSYGNHRNSKSLKMFR